MDQSIAVDDHSTVPGEQVTVNGDGAAPGSTVHLWLHSTPISLGTTVAGQDGTYSQLVTIPAGTASGAHVIEAIGTDPFDAAFSIGTSITVSLATAPVTSSAVEASPNAGTGASLGLFLVLLLAGIAGATMTFARDRRRGR